MKINYRLITTTVFILSICFSGSALSADAIATVVKAEERVVQVEIDTTQEPTRVTKGDQVFTNYTVRSGPPVPNEDDEVGGFLQMKLDESETLVRARDGSITFTEEDNVKNCEVTGIVTFRKRGKRRYKQMDCELSSGGFFFKHLETDFLINSRGVDTSLFVMEGSVEVSSINRELSQKVVVNAGEWLVTRKGEKIPPPKRYRRTDAVSGNSECIYSWCRLTREIFFEPPERLVIVPPPPNPPGRR